MAKVKADIGIGQRAFEEVLRILPKLNGARERLGMSSKQLIYDWMEGGCPGAGYLRKLHYCGADVIYILTGVRSK